MKCPYTGRKIISPLDFDSEARTEEAKKLIQEGKLSPRDERNAIVSDYSENSQPG